MQNTKLHYADTQRSLNLLCTVYKKEEMHFIRPYLFAHDSAIRLARPRREHSTAFSENSLAFQTSVRESSLRDKDASYNTATVASTRYGKTKL